MERPIILFLSSTSLHFPLDLHDILSNEGQESKRYESIDDFLSTPDRHTPYVAVLEIGSTEDVDRALFAYEWCEQIQPIAPCRTILLLASKNISLGDRAARFGNAEVAHLPLPLKNLLFKIDLQKRLLASDQAKAAAERGKQAPAPEEFSASFVERPPKLDRVLLMRGPGPKQGYWQEAGESPAGKVRWRWVSTQKPEDLTPAEKAGVTWAAESKVKPVYEEATAAWAVDDPEADLVGLKKDKPVFSARTSFRQPKVAGGGEKQNFAREKNVAESDRSFAKAEKASGTADVIEAQKQAGPDAAMEIKQAAAPPSAAEQNFGHQARAPAQTAQNFGKQVPPPAAAQQVIRPAEEKPGDTITPARAKDGAAAPEWKNHSAPAAPARAPLNQPRAATEAAAGKVETKRATAPAEAGKAGEEKAETIPVHFQEEEPADNSGYSVPVSSEVERKGAQPPAGPADETYSTRAPEHPRKEADYSASLPASVKAAYQESIAEKNQRPRAEAETAPPAGEKAARGMVNEEAIAGKTVPPEAAAPAPAAAASDRAERTPAARPEVTGAGKREQAASNRAGAAASDHSATHLPADAPTETESATRAAGQVPAREKEEIKIRGDAPAESQQTEVAIEGTTEHSGEEIRIRARAEGEAPAAERTAKGEAENFLKYRHFVTMTLAELSDRDSSWHPMHRYRIYLSANHRYYGVKDPATLLPLWVYEGELAPEFLEDKRAWKFYDRYPELYSTLDTLPPVVLDQIYVMAGKAPPSSFTGGPNSSAAVTEGSAVPASATTAPKEAAPERGLWGSVKSFFRTLLGG